MRLSSSIALLTALASPSLAQQRFELPVLQSPFHRSWQVQDLGMPAPLPAVHSIEGLTFDPMTGNLLLLIKVPNRPAELHSAPVIRAANGRITGFGTPTRIIANAGAVDSGLEVVSGTAFCPEYLSGNLQQIHLANAAWKATSVIALGSARPTGIGVVPHGMSGAGEVKLIDLGGSWFNVNLGHQGTNGIFPIQSLTKRATLSKTPYGIAFLRGAAAPFSPTASSALIAESTGILSLYTLTANGDPLPATRRVFARGMSFRASCVDSVTGDLILGEDPAINLVIVRRNRPSCGFTRLSGMSFKSGTGQSAPSWSTSGCITTGSSFQLQLRGGPAGAAGVLHVGGATWDQPALNGRLYLKPIVFFAHSLAPNGDITIPVPLPDTHLLLGSAWHFQSIYLDPATPTAPAWTNRLTIQVR